MAYGYCTEPLNSTGQPIQGGFGGYLNGNVYQVFGGCQADPNGIPGGSTGGCGSQATHNISAWYSPDLQNWTPVHGPGPDGAVILHMATDWPLAPAIAYSAKGLWNFANQEFVVWLFLNEYNTEQAGYYGILTATDPTGDWTIRSTTVTTLGNSVFLDDVSLVQDKTPPFTAYFSYTAYANVPLFDGHWVIVEQMTPSYYATLGTAAWSGPGSLFNYSEAQAMIVRNGQYCMSHGICPPALHTHVHITAFGDPFFTSVFVSDL